MATEKKYSSQLKEFAESVAKGDSERIVFGEGVVSATNGELKVELSIFDSNLKNENQHRAKFRFLNKGKACAELDGVVYGLLNPDTPITFRYFVGPVHGAVDIMKFYKVGDVIEGKIYPEDMSVAFKNAVKQDTTSVRLKERIVEERENHGLRAVIKINPELTFINVPDNTPVNKQDAQVEPSKGPKASL